MIDKIHLEGGTQKDVEFWEMHYKRNLKRHYDPSLIDIKGDELQKAISCLDMALKMRVVLLRINYCS